MRQPADLGGGTAAGLIVGNVAGGLAATAAYLLVTLLPSPAFLLLVVLPVGLLFGDRIARGGAPIYTVGLVTFLIVLGLGLSPLPQDSGSIFIGRVFDVMVAAVYAIGMASLLRSAFRAA
jgi:Fusaric acid resistance protein-like